MFWDKGYTPSQNIEALLEKENSTVEEFLDDEDILQECKTLKSIVKYFTRPEVIRRLVEIITTDPPEDLPLAQRFRHANMACEILTLGMPSLDEKILADEDTLKILYSYLENEPPLNPLLSSFFHKTFCMLFTKKLEQDWFLYQQMCLQLLEYLKSRKSFLDLIFRHFATPVIPELILQLLTDFEGGQLKRNLYEWLTEEKLVERLIAILGNPDECDKHSNVTEFLCDLIKQGRTMRQTEHENDSFEPAFDGSNPILKVIEGEASIEALLNVILETNAQESAIVSGISVVLTLIKPISVLDEAYSDRSKFIQNREKEIHEQIATTVIRVMAPRLKDLNQLLKTPPYMPPINTTAAKLEKPFGMTRLQVCRVFTVLLQTKNEDIAKAICETDFFETLLTLFKQYCWNNFLHNEVEKCMQIIFESSASNNNNNSAQASTIANDGSLSKNSINGDNGGTSSSFFDCLITNGTASEAGAVEANNQQTNAIPSDGSDADADVNATTTTENSATIKEISNELEAQNSEETKEDQENVTEHAENIDEKVKEDVEKAVSENDATVEMDVAHLDLDVDQVEARNIQSPIEQMDESNEDNSFKEKESLICPADTGPSTLQKHLIVKCKLITNLIDFWQHNYDMETMEKGRRLGYMGYLIKTLRHITNCISESEHIGALIESNLSDVSESEKWQSITNAKDGDLTKALATQNRLLANCNAHEACDFGHHLPKDFLSDNSTWEYIMSSNMHNNLDSFSDSNFIEGNPDAALNFVEDETPIGFNMFQFDNNFELDDDDDDDELAGAIGGIAAGAIGSGADGNNLSFFGKNPKTSSALQTLVVGNGMCSNPWYDVDPFANLKSTTTAGSAGPWATDFSSDNFADFDSHFSAFASDLGESLTSSKENDTITSVIDGSLDRIGSIGDNLRSGDTKNDVRAIIVGTKKRQEYDNNANVEKLPMSFDDLALKNDSSNRTREEDNIDRLDDDAVPPALVRTLQSVMQESEDDYEDDEGMWTKPLGPSANETETEAEAETDENNITKEKINYDAAMLNGTNQDHKDIQWTSGVKNVGDIATHDDATHQLKTIAQDITNDAEMIDTGAADNKKLSTQEALPDSTEIKVGETTTAT